MPTQIEKTANQDFQKTDKTQSPDAVSGRYTVWLVAAAVLVCATGWFFFSELHINLDTIGLFNPVYMYLRYGRMTYPTYTFFHFMIVHPPTHYFAVAFLMKAGIPFQYAISIPAFLLALLTFVAIVTGKFSNLVKVSLLCGSLIGVFQIMAIDLRPDLDMALAWFAGLVTLEAGRLERWDSKRLLLGAFLLTAASGTHYTGTLGWLGALVYVVWCILDLGWRNALKPVLSVILGGCLFGIPYLVLFVIPHWPAINSFVRSAHATGRVLTSIHSHAETYKLLYLNCATPVSRTVFFALRAGIPVVVIAFPVLLFVRQLRGLALASLPQLLFFLLFIQRKPNVPGYLFPEFILFGCAICVVFVMVLLRVEKACGPRFHWALPISSIVLVTVVLRITPWMQYTHLRARINELDIARAAGRTILGPNALVGARLSRFYTNGGAYSYMIEPDLLWRNIADLDMKSYFATFDAIAEDPFMSDATSNEQRKTLTSWYAEEALQLRGFFFANPSNVQSGLSYLLLSSNKSDAIQGYRLQADNQVAQFKEEAGGEEIFVAAICDSQFRLVSAQLDFSEFFLCPPH